MTTTVSFYITSLLKEKGFLCHRSDRFWRDGFSYEKKDYSPIAYQDKDNVATIFEVVMWLYEKHRIWISVDWMKRIKPYNSGFYCHLRGTNKSLNQDNFIVINDTLDPGYEVFNSPTEAYEAAFEYCLVNLIKEEKK